MNASMPDIFELLSGVYADLGSEQSLGSWSNHLGWSKFRLHRRFKKIMGETPRQHVHRLRLERAAASLVAGNDSVLTVAIAQGFGSHEVFNRAFRRRFRCSPTEYRAKAQTIVSRLDRTRHQNLVQSVGPCIFNFKFNANERRRAPLSQLEIVKMQIEEQPILYIQRRVASTLLQPLFAECFPKLFSHAMGNGLAMAGQPIARYVKSGSGLWTVDCAIPLLEKPLSEGEMQAGVLQGGPVVFTVHAGVYETLPETNAAMELWIEEQGLQSAGPAWEQYITSPTDLPDPADWKTNVYWPVCK